MTPESQRIAIAEACPFVKKATTDSPLEYDYSWFDKRGHAQRFDPLNDLNAMHEAEKRIFEIEDERGVIDIFDKYEQELLGVIDRDKNVFALHATAAQRAEAFLKTLGLWKEEPESDTVVARN